MRMKAGKLAPEKLAELVLGRFGHRRADVLVPARLGEDAAVLDFGDEVCVVSTDPITGASHAALTSPPVSVTPPRECSKKGRIRPARATISSALAA